MTILVGGIGSDDGIVLAVDRRMTSLATCAGQLHEHTSIFKITNLDKQKVAYAPVGDYITRDVGESCCICSDRVRS